MTEVEQLAKEYRRHEHKKEVLNDGAALALMVIAAIWFTFN